MDILPLASLRPSQLFFTSTPGRIPEPPLFGTTTTLALLTAELFADLYLWTTVTSTIDLTARAISTTLPSDGAATPPPKKEVKETVTAAEVSVAPITVEPDGKESLKSEDEINAIQLPITETPHTEVASDRSATPPPKKGVEEEVTTAEVSVAPITVEPDEKGPLKSENEINAIQPPITETPHTEVGSDRSATPPPKKEVEEEVTTAEVSVENGTTTTVSSGPLTPPPIAPLSSLSESETREMETASGAGGLKRSPRLSNLQNFFGSVNA